MLNAKEGVSHFNILKRNNCVIAQPFVRRDYYKICLVDGTAILYTEYGEGNIDKPCVFFSNPDIKFGWQAISEKQERDICLFNEACLSTELKTSLKK